MRKQFKKIALAAVFAMAVSLFAPAAQTAEAASKKTFTYAEQQTGDRVTALVMEPGEKTDLKFMGVSNWKSYTYKWTSSDEKVAVVDSNGMITALKKGVTTIKLMVGDGSEYTSVGVTVHVGLKQKASIGTSKEEDIKSYTLEMGESVVLKATGLMDNVADRYTCDWSSTNTSVAKISKDGVLTTVAPGLTVIQLTVTRVASGEKMETTPIAVLVTSKGGATVPATPTPTKKPAATATPIPTTVPAYGVTATPTPTPEASSTPAPSDEAVPYTAKLESDNCLLLTFNKAVDYDISDVSLYQLIAAGSAVVEVKTEVIDAKLSTNGKELRVVPATSFNDGEKYIVKVGTADTGKTVNVNIGEPVRIDVTYECLGTKKVAYAYDEDIALDVPVNLTYRLYTAGGVDVTETYNSKGWITYELAKENDNVTLDNDSLNFFKSGVSVVLRATFSYEEDDETKEIKGTVAIVSKKLPEYGISGVVKYTIVDDSSEKKDKIDWDKTEKEVVANTEDAKIVVLVADTYGNFFTNDERGVSEEDNIFLISDEDQLFAQFGYGLEFSAADNDKIVTGYDGSIYPYQQGNAVIVVSLTNNGLNGNSNYNKNIGACSVKILAESKLSSVSAEDTKVTVAGTALAGYEERFCEKDVEIILKDQYGKEWKGDYNLELSCATSDINSALDGSGSAPAVLDGTTLHIDAENIKAVAGNKTSVTFRVKETNLNKTVSITVSIKNPTLSSGEISVKGWELGVQDSKISLGNFNAESLTQSAVIEAFKVSSNGIQVGLYEDLHILDTANYKFTTSNCEKNEVYVFVQGPDGKPVEVAESGDSVGVYHDKLNNCIRVNVAAPGSSSGLVLDTLQPGTYSVKATRITDVGSTVKTSVLTEKFTVEDKTKDVSFRSLKSKKTSLTVSGEKDLEGIKDIIEEVFVFNLDGVQWTSFTADNIVDVEYVLSNRNVIIKSIEFAVPVDEDAEFSLSYTKLVKNINKAVEIGVDD